MPNKSPQSILTRSPSHLDQSTLSRPKRQVYIKLPPNANPNNLKQLQLPITVSNPPDLAFPEYNIGEEELEFEEGFDTMASSSSHLMKTTKRGRPFVKDTHDLYATMIVSLQLSDHRSFFKSYPNSFTTDESVINLSSLKFSQSNRHPDPKDPSRIITTTTTTTFSMTREMAKGICQHFMDARLIENASDISSLTFKDRGVYMLTPKGLHILERFVSKNGISADHLMRVFATQPICMKLLHLERRNSDDEILINKGVIEVLFRRFVGRQPNVSKLSEEQWSSQSGSRQPSTQTDEADRALGIFVKKYIAQPSSSSKDIPELIFSAGSALDWLCDFTTIVGRDEASEIAAHFVRYGFIKLVMDKASKGRVEPGTSVKVSVVGCPGGGGGAMMQEAEFRFGEKIMYKITLEGSRVARWDEKQPTNNNLKPSSNNGTSTPPRPSHDTDDSGGLHPNATGSSMDNAKLTTVTDRLRMDYLDDSSVSSTADGGAMHGKDSHTTRLKQILEEPALRSLFREFLRTNFCEENLSFWLDVQDFKRRFNTTSSAVASPGSVNAATKTHGHNAMEKHQQDLIAMAFVIYNTYLAPASSCELNIDHNLREELVGYMNKIVADVQAKEGINARSGTLDPAMAAKTLQASQLQTMVRLYERIQGYIFRLMATDSVPKFCKTDRYISLMKSVFDYSDYSAQDDTSAEKAAAKVEEEEKPSRTYVTISQAANEKQAAAQKAALKAGQT